MDRHTVFHSPIFLGLCCKEIKYLMAAFKYASQYLSGFQTDKSKVLDFSLTVGIFDVMGKMV